MKRLHSLVGTRKRLWGVVAVVCLQACATRAARSPNACLVNTTGISEQEPSIASDARAICQALDPSVKPLVGSLTADDVREAVSSTDAHVVFYTGHGERVSAREGGVRLEVHPASASLSAMDLLASFVGTDGPRSDADYRVLLLNTCDSGYVALSARGPLPEGHRSLPIGVIASGYGRIDRRAQGDSMNTSFGGVLGQALQGAADRPPFGNCDQIVTDEEAAAYVNDRLRLHARDHWDEWQVQPTAVLKRNVGFALPLVRTKRRGDCRAPDWNQIEAVLPQTLRDVVRVERDFLQGRGAPPEGPQRFVLLAESTLPPEQFAPAELARRLTPIAENLGWRVVDASSTSADELAQALRAASFLDAWVAEATGSPFGHLYLELTSPRDRAVLWAYEAPLPIDKTAASNLAKRLARRLRSRVELLAPELPSGQRLVVRVRGAVPRSIGAVPWDVFAEADGPWRGPAPYTTELFDANGVPQLEAAPCPGAVGQCFFLDNSTLARDPEPWILVPE